MGCALLYASQDLDKIKVKGDDLFQKYFNLINIIKILKKIIFKKKFSFFFPRIIISNKKLLFILKKLKSKIVYMSTARQIHITNIMPKYRWKKNLGFGQKEIKKFTIFL